MRDAATRRAHANLIKELSDVLTDVDDDKGYFQRLLWANEWIAHRLSDFEFDAVHEEEGEEEDDEYDE